MQAFLADYFPIVVFLGIALALSVVILGIPFLVALRNPDKEKLSSYECGFEPFEDARGKFDIRFYLIAILFIIFDLEIAFLFPWAVVLGDIGRDSAGVLQNPALLIFAFWSMVVFLTYLTIGFIYEWKKGALEWE